MILILILFPIPLNVQEYKIFNKRSQIIANVKCHSKLKETNISNEHNRLKNPNWQEADQLAIYKHDRGVELVHQETTPAKWSERDLNP